MVSNLCEAAAEAIGANPILAKVGALYHDIGKLKRPLFFVENQSYFGIDNPHKNHNPLGSKMLITAHTKEGVEIAKKYGLPSIINNFILQHHGEGLVSYFYNEAVKEEGAENVQEEQFRYSGPKPNMKETAILMLADAIESAVRSLKTPTTDEIENIIDKIIVDRLNDGQLSDSPLTLKDLKIIANTFSRILRGMQHERIKYQEQDEKYKYDINPLPGVTLDEDLEQKINELESKNSNSSEE
jgi:putative nucleotidyltransferase with HDIG domain